MVFSLRFLAAVISQRMASASRRDGPHFDRHLIRGTTDAARTHLERGLHVVERFVERFHRGALELAFDALERRIDDTFGN